MANTALPFSSLICYIFCDNRSISMCQKILAHYSFKYRTYGTAQMQLDARAYITHGFFTCCLRQPVRVPAYMPVKG